MADLDVSILLRLIYRQGNQARRAIRDLQKVKAAARGLRASVGSAMAGAFSTAALQRSMRRQQALIAAHRSALTKQALALAAIFAGPVRGAVKFEDAMADVRKVTNASKEETRALGAEVLRLTRSIPRTGAELAQIMAAGGRSGIKGREGLAGFTEDVSRIAVAWDVAAEATGDAMAVMKAVFFPQKTFVQVREQLMDVANAINFAADNSEAKAPAILSFFTNAQSAAKALGITARETAAFGAFFSTLGISGLRAGTRMRTAFTKFKLATVGTKEARKGVQALGFSIRQFERGLRDNPLDLFVETMKRLQKMDSIKASRIMTDIFGVEIGDAINAIVQNLDGFLKQLRFARGELDSPAKTMERFNSVNQEFANKLDTTKAKLQLFWNRLKELGIVIGNQLLGPINQVVGALGGMVTRITEAAKAYPKLTEAVVQGGTLMLAGLTEITAIRLAIASMKFAGAGALLKLTGLFALFRTAGGLAKGVAKLAPALLLLKKPLTVLATLARAHPVLALISGLAAGAALIMTNWDRLGPFFQDLWDGIKQSFDDFLAWISSFGTRLSDALAGTVVGRLLGMEKSKPGEGTGAVKPGGDFKFLPPMVAPDLAPGFFVKEPSGGLPHLELPQRKPLVRMPAVRPRAALDQSKAILAQARRLASSQLPATAAAGAPPRGQQPPAGITINAQGPTVHVKQAPPNVSISVTVNVTQTNADPGAIGQATGKAVGAEVRKSMFDGVGAG